MHNDKNDNAHRDFLSPDDTLCDVRASDRDGLLRELTGRAAEKASARRRAAGRRDRSARTARLDRHGRRRRHSARPHRQPVEALWHAGAARRAIDFAAIDGKPVDIVFLLLLPTTPHGEQLTALAGVARKLRDAQVTADLRGANDSAGIYRAIIANSP